MPSKSPRTPKNTVRIARKPAYQVGDKILLEVEVTRVGDLGGREAITVKLPGSSVKHTYGAEYLPNHIKG